MPQSRRKTDALLKDDHRTVEELFEQFEKASGEGRKQKLAQQICLELSVHATIEEEIFYPACEGKIEEDLLKEAYVEHDGAKVLIAQIQAGDGQSDEYFDAKVKVLQEQIEHHVRKGKGLEGCSVGAQAGSTWNRWAATGAAQGRADCYILGAEPPSRPDAI